MREIISGIKEAGRRAVERFLREEKRAQAVPIGGANQTALDRVLRREACYPSTFNPADALVTKGTLSLVRGTGSRMGPYNPRRPTPPTSPEPAA